MLRNLFLGALVAIVSAPAMAATLFDSGETAASATGFTGSDAELGFFRAAGFTLGANSTVTGVTFAGLYNGDEQLTPDNFTIAFFEDNAGSPEVNALASFSITTARVDSGIDSSGSDVFDYSATFAGVNLNAGDYYVSIFNTSTVSNDDDWGWMFRAGPGLKYGRSDAADPWLASPGTHVFTIEGSVVGAVPLPGGLVLLLGGLCLAGVAVRRT